MSRIILVALIVLISPLVAHALQMTLETVPPGAEVFASPVDEPVAYRKGVTPCAITLSDDRGPHTLLLRKVGYFDYYCRAAAGFVSMPLSPRSAGASWARVPRLDDTTRAWPPSVGDEPDLPTPASRPRAEWCSFAPDASGVLVRGHAGNERLLGLGLANLGEDRSAEELWWVPARGAASLLWRTVSGPNEDLDYRADAAFSPNPNWLVHSAYVNHRERLDLLRLSDRKRITIAADRSHTLYYPVFSADGRQIACVSRPTRGNLLGPMVAGRPAAIEVMAWDGSGRHIVARDAYVHTPPAFSPDGSEVAFVNASGQVAVVTLATGQVRVIAHRTPWWPLEAPVWSPDGARLAYTAFQNTPPGPPDQYSEGCPVRTFWAKADGSLVRGIPGVTLHGWLDVFYLGVYAAGYCAEAGAPTRSLLRADLAGQQTEVLRQTEALLYSAELSPDGGTVAAMGWRPGKAPAVALVGTTSGRLRWVELPSAVGGAGSPARQAGPAAVSGAGPAAASGAGPAVSGAGFPARQAQPTLSPPPSYRLHWLEPAALLVALPDGSQCVIDTQTLTAEPTPATVIPAATPVGDPPVLCLDGDLSLSDPAKPYPRRWLTTFAWYGPLGPNTLREGVSR